MPVVGLSVFTLIHFPTMLITFIHQIRIQIRAIVYRLDICTRYLLVTPLPPSNHCVHHCVSPTPPRSASLVSAGAAAHSVRCVYTQVRAPVSTPEAEEKTGAVCVTTCAPCYLANCAVLLSPHITLHTVTQRDTSNIAQQSVTCGHGDILVSIQHCFFDDEPPQIGELQTKVREDFTITEKAPSKAFTMTLC